MVEQSGVFVLQSDNSLISMEPAQFATEDDFQHLLARFTRTSRRRPNRSTKSKTVGVS